LVCSALASKKFITENNLRLISKTGPPSGQSTTVTYAFEILERSQQSSMPQEPWTELRGVGKDIFAELGGGEAFLREERAQFSTAAKYREGESGSKV
jgi:hypothetical protein